MNVRVSGERLGSNQLNKGAMNCEVLDAEKLAEEANDISPIQRIKGR